MDILIRIILLIVVSMMLGAGLMFVALKDVLDLNKLGWLKNWLFEPEEESE